MKRKPTKEEIAEKEEQSRLNRVWAGFRRTLETRIRAGGFAIIRKELEYLKDHASSPLPRPEFTHSQHVALYEDVINEHIKHLKRMRHGI